MKNFSYGLYTLCGIIVLSACGHKNNTTVYPEEKKGGHPGVIRNDPPNASLLEKDIYINIPGSNYVSTVPLSKIQQLANSENIAGIKLFKALTETSQNDNLLISPLSINSAFSLLYPGAKGDTASQIAQALGFDTDVSAFNTNMASLLSNLTKTSQNVPQESKFKLNINNNVWLQKDFPIQENYLNTVKSFYNAAQRLEDFAQSPEQARLDINKQVADDTFQRITNILPQGSINSATKMVLTNSIYFLADWLSPFLSESTKPENFTKINNSKMKVSMMNQRKHFKSLETATYQAVELPYVGEKLAMLMVLPKNSPSEFQSFQKSFDASTFENIIAKLSVQEVDLSLPKFEFSWGASSLKEILVAQGMQLPFDEHKADFSNLTDRDIFVSDVFHKTFIKVDEKSTEAAAATGIEITTTSAILNPTPPMYFKVDHPALFFIYAVDSHVILFVGQLLEPTAAK